MHKEIDVYESMNEIMKQLKKGVLMTTKKDGKVNTMSIAWGAVGIEWNKLLFIGLVRKSRYTHTMLESGEFTVNMPLEDSAKDVIVYCGTKSGRDTDKIADMGFTLVDGRKVKAPAITELPMTLECKTLYEQDQDENALPKNIKDSFYADEDYHTMYFAEIVDAYIVE